MSFSSDTKKELCKFQLKYDELICAEAYGMLLFSKKFSEKEISFRTESGAVVNRFTQIITERTGSIVEMQSTLTVKKDDTRLYSVNVPDESDCHRIFAYFGHSSCDVSLRINRANIENEQCAAAFLRGVFLNCGSISDPENEYHLEFVVQHKNLSEDLCKLITETTAFISDRIISPKIMKRRGMYIVYLKDSEDISDMLTLIGAMGASMSVMQAKIMKSYKNATNRKVNSQVANTDKSYAAAAKQIQAICVLKDSGILQTLSEDLQEVARLRISYPQASLKDLGAMLAIPLSKSGINHRLGKLMELAKKEEENLKIT